MEEGWIWWRREFVGVIGNVDIINERTINRKNKAGGFPQALGLPGLHPS